MRRSRAEGAWQRAVRRDDARAMDFRGWIDDELAGVRAAGRWRSVRAFDALGPVGAIEGRDVVSFAREHGISNERLAPRSSTETSSS